MKFKVHGKDSESGVQTSLVVDAGSERDAGLIASDRGVVVTQVECMDARTVSAHLSRESISVGDWPPLIYWRQFERSVAKGVFFGLLAFALLPFVILAVLYAIGDLLGS